ncbi:MAG: alpha/beta hydrolase, partial [Mariniphaga sp.]|nr:alpha/beta hydrolase [Mariniphaga sp.]
MKTLLRIFFLMAVFSLVAGCNKTDEFFSENAVELKKAPIVNPAQGLDQERFVTMKDVDLTIHYRVIGKGPIDMVFIPGWTNPLTVYTKQFDYFRDKARCIYIDLPGHG